MRFVTILPPSPPYSMLGRVGYRDLDEKERFFRIGSRTEIRQHCYRGEGGGEHVIVEAITAASVFFARNGPPMRACVTETNRDRQTNRQTDRHT